MDDHQDDERRQRITELAALLESLFRVEAAELLAREIEAYGEAA